MDMNKSRNVVGATTYQHIKTDIIFGVLEPGTNLNSTGFANAIRPACLHFVRRLNRLASEGFVDARDQRGFFVASVSPEDLTEIANLRVLLECHALELSIRNGDTEWEGNLVAAHHKLHLMEQKMLAGDKSGVKDWKRYDWEFHKALISACNSENLLSLHSVLFDKYLRYQMLKLTHRGEEAAQEHQDMLSAALDRDEARAAEVLTRHIKLGLEHTLDGF